ncbi:gliding motility-associated C-terminal domain-containing protein [Pedobacter sp. L105]|uniref:DUF7507 domain-containing protein n=1 Tax=Pedobacter sp. L105 TaxID=1641871 RepID=UPI00131B215D|nr:gliding motility-associated C-terminal domain-containing protein [Pedobacter sp. L105]
MIKKLLSNFFIKCGQELKVNSIFKIALLLIVFVFGISSRGRAENPGVIVLKTGTLSSANNSIIYTITVINTGDVPLHNIILDDPKAFPKNAIPLSVIINPGDSYTLTGAYAITLGEKDAGVVKNTADLYATSPGGTTLYVGSQPSLTARPNTPTVTNVPETPSVALVKTAILSTDKNSIAYTFLITNTGNVTLSSFTLDDDNFPGVFTIPSATTVVSKSSYPVLSHTYQITQADRDADMVINTAKVQATSNVKKTPVSDLSGNTQLDDTPNVILLPEHPSITMVKTGALSNDGNNILYSFAITNTGDVTVKNLTITDPKIAGAYTFSPSNNVAPGATVVAMANYTIPQLEKDAGRTTNQATVRGTTTANHPTATSGNAVGNTLPTTIIIPPHPLVSLVKIGVLSPDQSSIHYTLTISNTGNVTLNNFTLTDTKLSAFIIPANMQLAPGQSMAYTGDYAVTQADKDADQVTNMAKVTALSNLGTRVFDNSGTAVSNDLPTVVPIPEMSSIALVKTGVYTADTNTINYTFTVTNTGTVTLKNVAMTDPKINVPFIFSPAGNLAPGKTTVATAVYAVPADDKDVGEVINTATVTANSSSKTVSDISGTAQNNDLPTVVIVSDRPAVNLVKTGVLSNDGNTVTYSFIINNTGDLTLQHLILTDAKLPGTLAIDPAQSVRPGASKTLTAIYTVTQAEKDAHRVVNSASITGTSFTGLTISDVSGTNPLNDDPTVIAVPENPSVKLVKTGILSTDENTITYTFTLTNTGSVTLKGLTLTDVKLPAFIIDPSETLSPGANKILTAIYTVTQAEKDAGTVTNTAVATGVSPAGTIVNDVSGTTQDNDNATVIAVPLVGAMKVTKLANGTIPITPGNLVNYTLKVTNIGTVTLRNISVNDPNAVVTGGSPIPALASQESAEVTATHQLTQSDIDAGKVINQATANGTMPDGSSVIQLSDDPSTVAVNDPTITPITEQGALALVKTGIVNANATIITYTFTVTNTGNVTLKNITLSDPLLGGMISQSPSDLSPGQSIVITHSYNMTQQDRDNAKVTNSATATALTPLGLTVTDISGTDPSNDTPTVVLIGTIPGIDLVKTGVITTDFATVTYAFRAVNTGNVTLQNLNLTDTKLSSKVVLSNTVIEPRGVVTGTAVYTVTDQEKRDGLVSNTATITGSTPTGEGSASDISGTAEDNDDPTVIIIDKSPQAVNDHAETTIDHPVTFSITGNDLPSFNGLDAGSIVITKFPLFGQLEIHTDGTVTYTPNRGYAGPDDFMYTVTDLKGKLSNRALVSINVSLINLFIPNTFTPNGDGRNDTFQIVGKEDFDSIDVVIINRWGSEVYHNRNYQDNWDGSNLGEGTYYYIITLKKGTSQVVKKGWILLKR